MNDEYELDDNPAYAIAELLGMINRLTHERMLPMLGTGPRRGTGGHS